MATLPSHFGMSTVIEQVLLSLRQAVRERPNCRAFAFIDPALVDSTRQDPLVCEMQGMVWNTQPAIVSIPISIISRERQPYLIEIADSIDGDRLLSAVMRAASREREEALEHDVGVMRAVCAWIVTNGQDESDLQARLAQRLSRASWIRSPHDGVHTVFRFWDPRITTHLPRIIGNAEWSNLIGSWGLSAWLCLGEDNALQRFAGANAKPEQPANAWQIDANRWLAMKQIGWAHRVCQLAPKWHESLIDVGFDRALAIISRATRHGMRDEADLLRFAHAALTLHSDFDTHPLVVNFLTGFRERGCPMGEFSRTARQWDEQTQTALRNTTIKDAI